MKHDSNGTRSPLIAADPTQLTHEQQFIIACIRHPFALSATLPKIPSLEWILDWEQTFKLVFSQGLAPLVYSGLTPDLAIPTTVRSLLKTGNLSATVRTETWLEPNLRKVLQTLDSLGLEPIVIKGAALAYLAYPQPIHRTMNDVDLLLPRAHLARASDALRQLGSWTKSEDLQPEHHLRMHYVEDGQVGVELHQHVLPSPNPYAIDLDGFRSRAQVATIAGVPARALSAVDSLHVNCVHLAYAHRYHWFPLRSLVDILAITTSRAAEFDWEALVKSVRLARTAGAVYWPLWLSRTWLGAPIPSSVLAQLAPARGVRRAVATIMDSPFLLDPDSAAGDDVLYHLLVEFSLYSGCSTIEQARAFLRCLFPAPDEVGHLPPDLTQSRFRYVSYLARPRRVINGITSVGRLIRQISQEKFHRDNSSVRNSVDGQTLKKSPVSGGGL